MSSQSDVVISRSLELPALDVPALDVPALDVDVHLGTARFEEPLPLVPELDRLSPRAVPARRASFLAGRWAARRALSARWGTLPAALRIDADERGQPVVPGAHLSITHAEGWAIAGASGARLGLDLVAVEELPDAMRDDAFAPGELETLARALEGSSDPRFALCLGFAVKEAALKWLGIGMAVPLPSVRVTPRAPLAPARVLRAPATLEHPSGREELELRAFAVAPELWCALLR